MSRHDMLVVALIGVGFAVFGLAITQLPPLWAAVIIGAFWLAVGVGVVRESREKHDQWPVWPDGVFMAVFVVSLIIILVQSAT